MTSQNEALDWLAGLFREPRERITPDTPRDEIGSWDSLGVLELMGDLDEKFDIILSDEEMQSLRKIGDVLTVLRERGKLGS